MIIDCNQCEMNATEHCQDCFVMAVLSRKRDAPFVIEAEEEPAIIALQAHGLAPMLKFRRKAG